MNLPDFFNTIFYLWEFSLPKFNLSLFLFPIFTPLSPSIRDLNNFAILPQKFRFHIFDIFLSPFFFSIFSHFIKHISPWTLFRFFALKVVFPSHFQYKISWKTTTKIVENKVWFYFILSIVRCGFLLTTNRDLHRARWCFFVPL